MQFYLRFYLKNLCICDFLCIFAADLFVTSMAGQKDGFKGERSVVLSPLVTDIERHDPLASSLYVTDIGYYPRAYNHFCERKKPITENVLYNDLRGRGFRVDVGNVNIRVRDEKGVQQRVTLEVDFVCNMGSKRYYVQSAWRMPDEAKMKQEQNSLCQIKDEFRKLIVVGERIKLHRNEKGITIASVYDLLLDKTTIDQ
jgi:hypothetical protein